MAIFKIRAPGPMKEGQNWNYIRHLKDESLVEINVMPTQESIDSRHLEWIIPDISYNRVHVGKYYSNFEIIEEGEAAVETKKVISKQTVPYSKVVQEKKYLESKPAVVRKRILNPMEIKKLKAKIRKELDANGIDYPINATLKVLQTVKAAEMK